MNRKSILNDKSKAVDAAQKAVEALKSKKYFNKADMAAFESRLRLYSTGGKIDKGLQ
jgi:hypothetical protein